LNDFSDWNSFDCLSDRAADFLASHLLEIPSLFLQTLPTSVVAQILSRDCLQIESEDSLLDIILSRLERDGNGEELLEFVRFEFLASNGIDRFISWSCEHFDSLHVTISVWKCVTKRLSLNVTPGYVDSRLPARSFVPTPGSPLNGIIAFLTKEHGGNVEDRGIVSISSSSVSGRLSPKNAADLGQQNYFHSLGQPNQWLSYDFKTRRVKITHYSIAAHANNYYLRSWVIEGSMDGQANSWVTLDSRTNNTEADSDHPIVTFEVTGAESYRFIRLRQTGKCAGGDDYLVLYGFEMFGFLTG
jgi:hypothetical protein